MHTYIILHRQLITNKPVVQTVADMKVVVVFLHLVLDLLIQEAQFHHEDQACHAGKPVPPHLGIPQHKQHPSDHLTNTICLHYNSIYSTSASSPNWARVYNTHYHMQVVHEVHRQGCELQNQLHIVHVGCLVLPVPTVVHVPEVDHIPASVKIRSRNVEWGGHMHTHNMHMFVVATCAWTTRMKWRRS